MGKIKKSAASGGVATLHVLGKACPPASWSLLRRKENKIRLRPSSFLFFGERGKGDPKRHRYRPLEKSKYVCFWALTVAFN